MTILGSAYVEIRAIDTHLKRDIEAAAKKIKDITVTVKADVDLAPVRSSIAALRAEVNKNPLKFKSELDDEGVVDGILKAHQLAEDNSLKMNTEVDTFGIEAGLLFAQEHYKDNPLTLETQPNTTLLEAELERIHTKYGTMASNILPRASTAVAERQLNHTARTRIANIRANISILNDKQINEAVLGFRNALTGMIPPQAIKNAITGLFGNLEGLAIKGALVATAVGSISSAILTLGANIFTVSGGILDSIGILAMAPALLYGGVAMIMGTKMAWKGFFDTFDEDAKKAEEALAKLPPQAQDASRALRGLWTELQKSSQETYWEELGTTLQDVIIPAMPVITDGFNKVSVAGAKITKSLLGAFDDFRSSGQMEKVFDNIARGMTNASESFGNFFRGFNTFATVGSTFLPRFGTWVDGLAISFRDWAEEAERTGKMTRWIEDAVSSLRDMGSILSSSGSILKGFTIISDLSGGKSLNDMANGMRNIADVVNGEPFRSRMVNVFIGAREGMDALGEGIGNLMSAMGKGHRTLSEFLALTGEIGGTILTNFASMGEGTNFGAGLIKFLQGAKTAAQQISPAFKDAGDIIGNLGEIGATLLTSLAPGLNKLFDTLNQAIEAMMDGVIDAIPVFNDFIQSVVEVLAPVVVGLAEAFGNLLEAFVALPDPIRNLIMWAGLLAIAFSKFSGFMGGFRKSMGEVGTGMTNTAQKHFGPFLKSLNNIGPAVSNVGDKFRALGRTITDTSTPFASRVAEMGRSVRQFGTDFSAGMKDALFNDSEIRRVPEGFARMREGVVTNVQAMGAGIRTAGTDIRGGLRAVVDQADYMARSVATAIPGGTRALDGMRAAATNLANNFKENAQSIANTAKGFGGYMAPIRGAMGDLRESIGQAREAIGGSVNKGLRGAISGLSGAFGGGWGAALMAAGIGISLYASKLAEAKADVDALADSIDQNSGRITYATERLLAGMALDGVTDGWDDLWRGFYHGAQSTEETLSQLGISTEKYLDIVKDPKQAQPFIDSLNKAGNALRHGVPLTEEMAAALGMTKAELSTMDAESLTYLADKAEGAAEKLAKAQEKTEGIADALGISSAAAAIMQTNWDTLSNTASTASQRFQALKQNIELLTDAQDGNNRKTMSAISAEKAYQQTLADVGTQIQAVRDQNDGLVNNLFDVTTGFDLTSQAGRDLHTALSTQADGILTIGTAAMDQALKQGKSLEEAQKIAMQTMLPAIDTLKQSLAEMDFAPDQINAIVEALGLVPENVTTALGVEGGEAARQEIFLTQLAASAYASGNYAGVLAALPESAKAAIAEATGTANDFATGKYEAVVTALNSVEGGVSGALSRILSLTDPTHEAVLKALNQVGPGVDAAGIKIASVTDKDWTALLKAQYNGANDPSIENALAYLARNRTATITAQYIDGQAARPGQVVRNGQVGMGANGAIIKSMSNIFSGSFPMAKAFANGGIENHVAQISRGQTPFRVWSEPETGGEAYLPLAKSKRPRSEKILEEVARIFGFSLVKKLSFANGGILSGFDTGRKSGVSVNYGTTPSTAQQTSYNPAGAPNVTMNVYPSANLNEEQIGESAMNHMFWKLNTM